MNRRLAVIGLFFSLLAALVATGPAMAAGRTASRATLTPTTDGALIHASGSALYQVQGQVETITVKVKAHVPDGTMFAVFVTAGPKSREPVWLDWVTIAGGQGQLFVVSPVSNPPGISVFDGNWTQILGGTFR